MLVRVGSSVAFTCEPGRASVELLRCPRLRATIKAHVALEVTLHIKVLRARLEALGGRPDPDDAASPPQAVVPNTSLLPEIMGFASLFEDATLQYGGCTHTIALDEAVLLAPLGERVKVLEQALKLGRAAVEGGARRLAALQAPAPQAAAAPPVELPAAAPPAKKRVRAPAQAGAQARSASEVLGNYSDAPVLALHTPTALKAAITAHAQQQLAVNQVFIWSDFARKMKLGSSRDMIYALKVFWAKAQPGFPANILEQKTVPSPIAVLQQQGQLF